MSTANLLTKPTALETLYPLLLALQKQNKRLAGGIKDRVYQSRSTSRIGRAYVPFELALPGFDDALEVDRRRECVLSVILHRILHGGHQLLLSFVHYLQLVLLLDQGAVFGLQLLVFRPPVFRRLCVVGVAARFARGPKTRSTGLLTPVRVPSHVLQALGHLCNAELVFQLVLGLALPEPLQRFFRALLAPDWSVRRCEKAYDGLQLLDQFRPRWSVLRRPAALLRLLLADR